MIVMQHPAARWVQVDETGDGWAVRCNVCGASGVVVPEGVDVFASEHQNHAAPGYLGAGGLLKRATQAIGIEPCGGCDERAERLDRILPSIWKR